MQIRCQVKKKSNNICKERANIYMNGFMDLCGLKYKRK